MKTIGKAILSTFGVIIGIIIFFGVACSNPDIKEEQNVNNKLKFETVEDDNFKVEFVKIGEDLFIEGFKVKITNKTNENLNVSVEEAYIGDKNVDCVFFSQIAANKNNSDNVTFIDYDEIKSIKSLKGLKVKFKAQNNVLDTLSELETELK